jgi:hypothetical protein
MGMDWSFKVLLCHKSTIIWNHAMVNNSCRALWGWIKALRFYSGHSQDKVVCAWWCNNLGSIALHLCLYAHMLFSLFLFSVCLCLCLCVVSMLPLLLPQKQTHLKKREKKKGILRLHNCCNRLCVVSVLPLLLPQKQTHQKKGSFTPP